MLRSRHSLEEILFTVDAVASAEALLRQLDLAVAALQTLAVPLTVQHFEDEAVHDVLTAACTHGDVCGGDSVELFHTFFIILFCMYTCRSRCPAWRRGGWGGW